MMFLQVKIWMGTVHSEIANITNRQSGVSFGAEPDAFLFVQTRFFLNLLLESFLLLRSY